MVGDPPFVESREIFGSLGLHHVAGPASLLLPVVEMLVGIL